MILFDVRIRLKPSVIRSIQSMDQDDSAIYKWFLGVMDCEILVPLAMV